LTPTEVLNGKLPVQVSIANEIANAKVARLIENKKSKYCSYSFPNSKKFIKTKDPFQNFYIETIKGLRIFKLNPIFWAYILIAGFPESLLCKVFEAWSGPGSSSFGFLTNNQAYVPNSLFV
jgi:hypothetical protein